MSEQLPIAAFHPSTGVLNLDNNSIWDPTKNILQSNAVGGGEESVGTQQVMDYNKSILMIIAAGEEISEGISVEMSYSKE